MLRRDLAIAARSGGGWFYALLFFAIFAVLGSIALGPERAALAAAAPAMIWLAAAFAFQLAGADIFESDFRDGSLRALGAEHQSLVGYAAAKAALVFLTAGAPLVVAAPLFLTFFSIPPDKVIGGAGLLALGAPALVMISQLTAGLATGLRAGGLLALLVAAPFLAPPLIFGVMAMEGYFAGGLFWSPEALILAGLSLAMTAITPGFTVAALRLGLE